MKKLSEVLYVHAGCCPKCGALMALMGKDGAYCPKCEPEKAPYNPSAILHIKPGGQISSMGMKSPNVNLELCEKP